MKKRLLEVYKSLIKLYRWIEPLKENVNDDNRLSIKVINIITIIIKY